MTDNQGGEPYTSPRSHWTRKNKIQLAIWVSVGVLVAIVGFSIGAAAQSSDHRAALVHQLETGIKHSAQQAVTTHLLTGPILDVTCLSTGDSGNVTNYNCLAAYKMNADGTEQGYNFDGTIDWDTGQYTWRIHV